MELEFLFSAHHLMMVYICIKFHKNILNSISYSADTISNGNYSVKMKVELLFLFSAYGLIMFHICSKFCQNISKGLGVIVRTLFPL